MDWNEIFKSTPKIGNKVNLSLFKSIFGSDRSKEIFDALKNSNIWTQPSINFGGNLIPIPRLNAWFGDSGKSFTYSGIRLNPMPWGIS